MIAAPKHSHHHAHLFHSDMSCAISESSGLERRREVRPVTSLLYAAAPAFAVTFLGMLLLQRNTVLLHWLNVHEWACLDAVRPVRPGELIMIMRVQCTSSLASQRDAQSGSKQP
jgi:hypothetical protein